MLSEEILSGCSLAPSPYFDPRRRGFSFWRCKVTAFLWREQQKNEKSDEKGLFYWCKSRFVCGHTRKTRKKCVRTHFERQPPKGREKCLQASLHINYIYWRLDWWILTLNKKRSISVFSRQSMSILSSICINTFFALNTLRCLEKQ